MVKAEYRIKGKSRYLQMGGKYVEVGFYDFGKYARVMPVDSVKCNYEYNGREFIQKCQECHNPVQS